MNCKVFVVLALLLTISNLGNALKCNLCSYDSSQPKDEQRCTSATVDCSSGYCFAVKYTRADGTVVVKRDCANTECPNAKETCERRIKSFNLKSCVGTCCSSDNCNNDTPSSASGVMATKFILCLMAIAGFLFA